MSIRVTQTMMNTQLLSNISNNLSRMSNLQNQLSTGRKINAPSDDPVGITYSLRYRSELDANNQYIKNVSSATSMLEYTDTTVGEAIDVMKRARDLLVQGANGSNDQTGLDAIKTEISQLYNQLVEIGNSQFNGKQVFNGENSGAKPYPQMQLEETPDPNADPPQLKAYQVGTDDGEVRYELASGMTLSVNITGNELFGEPASDADAADSDNAFLVLKKAYDLLSAGDSKGISNLLGQFDSRVNTMLEQRSEVGARTNRIEMIQNRLDDIDLNLQTVRTKTEDADVTEVITNLKMEENVYQASLSVGAQIIRPSLVDFLK